MAHRKQKHISKVCREDDNEIHQPYQDVIASGEFISNENTISVDSLPNRMVSNQPFLPVRLISPINSQNYDYRVFVSLRLAYTRRMTILYQSHIQLSKTREIC